jgi:predicted anti-sigma-YlaC factor YlaD
MNCTQAEEMVSLFCDGEIDGIDESALFIHMSECNLCRTFLQRIVGLRTALASTPEPAAPVSLDRRIRQISRGFGMARAFSGRFWTRRFSISSPVFAAILVLIAVSITFSLASFFHGDIFRPKEPPQVVYIMSLEPIEVQGNVPQQQTQ